MVTCCCSCQVVVNWTTFSGTIEMMSPRLATYCIRIRFSVSLSSWISNGAWKQNENKRSGHG